MTGIAFSQPVSGQFMDALGSYAVIVLGKPPEDFDGAIGGPIINDNDFEPHVALGEKVANRVFNTRFFITRSHDDRALNRSIIRVDAWVSRAKLGQCRQTTGPLQMK